MMQDAQEPWSDSVLIGATWVSLLLCEMATQFIGCLYCVLSSE